MNAGNVFHTDTLDETYIFVIFRGKVKAKERERKQNKEVSSGVCIPPKRIVIVFEEKRPFALLPPSGRPFLISGTAGNFVYTPPSYIFFALQYIYIYRIYNMCTHINVVADDALFHSLHAYPIRIYIYYNV